MDICDIYDMWIFVIKVMEGDNVSGCKIATFVVLQKNSLDVVVISIIII